MRLSWNEIRARAARFADEWRDAAYEKGETQSFYNEFFEIFGVRRRSVARYEEHVKKLDNRSGFIDLFWPGVLIVEQKSEGRDLEVAYGQAGEYFDSLPERDRPRYILVSDFQSFELHDLDEGEQTSFALVDLPSHVEAFGFILGVQRRIFRDQDPVNVEASASMGRLHDALEASGYSAHDLEVFLVRTVFCLFADDTGIFEPRDLFLDLLETRTREDGSDLGPALARLFQVLNTPVDQRQAKLDEDLARFPYVNGDLFAARLTIPDFDAAMRSALIDACRFDWAAISPAIFGALFQSVMDAAERRAQGAHYTTEKNILKVIEPLVLDDLRAEFNRLRARKDKRRRGELTAFQKRLGGMKFFDPACGCGNFLIIAYRELRELEIDLIRELRRGRGDEAQRMLDATDLSQITVDQFYGIEIGEFPVRIAETALWMMDHIMNNRLSLAFGRSYVRIPLEGSPHILNADALETDWTALVAARGMFIRVWQSTIRWGEVPERRAARPGAPDRGARQERWHTRLCDRLVHQGRESTFRGDGPASASSPRTQSRRASRWRSSGRYCLTRANLEIAFAHRTFAWGSDARGKAHVHVAVVGLDGLKECAGRTSVCSAIPTSTASRRRPGYMPPCHPIFLTPPGLTDPHLVVREESRPGNGMGTFA